MIRHVCTHCSVPLTLDVAFAGGNCRCHKCGTIQRVAGPAEILAAETAEAEASARAAQPMRKLLGAGVAGAGGRAKHRKSVMMIAAGAGVLLAVIAPIFFYLMQPTDIGSTVAASPQLPGGRSPLALAGIPVTGKSVIFLVDRGGGERLG